MPFLSPLGRREDASIAGAACEALGNDAKRQIPIGAPLNPCQFTWMASWPRVSTTATREVSRHSSTRNRMRAYKPRA
jgi:hypothetical protein